MKLIFAPLARAGMLGLLAVSLQAAAVQSCNTTQVVQDAPDARYTDNGDGTVTDTRTGLTWKQCSEGATFAGGASCTGTPATFTWSQALVRAQQVNAGAIAGNLGRSDWRVPNRNELDSLIERACVEPAANLTRFPDTLAASYWSASPYARSGTLAWYADFLDGQVGVNVKGGLRALRLVRGGQ